MTLRSLRLPNASRLVLVGALPLAFSAAASAGDFKWVQDTKSCEPPQYPAETLKKGEQGTTVLRILVGADGRAIDSEVETSSKYRKLDVAAQRALMECTFKPTGDAKPVQQWVQQAFVWKLS